MPQQLCSHPCLSRVRSYTVSSQPLEMHRDCALSGRLQAATVGDSSLPQHNTQGNPGKSSPVPSRAPACPAQVPPAPRASDCCGAGFPGLPHSLSGYSRSSPRSQPGPVPPAAVTISLLTPQPHWKHRQEQTTSRPGRAGGASKAMTGTVAVVGTRLPWYKHGGGAASTS